MDDQIRIKEKAHFYTEKKNIVELYANQKTKQGYKVQIKPASPKGWVVNSYIWLKLEDENE